MFCDEGNVVETALADVSVDGREGNDYGVL